MRAKVEHSHPIAFEGKASSVSQIQRSKKQSVGKLPTIHTCGQAHRSSLVTPCFFLLTQPHSMHHDHARMATQALAASHTHIIRDASTDTETQGQTSCWNGASMVRRRGLRCTVTAIRVNWLCHARKNNGDDPVNLARVALPQLPIDCLTLRAERASTDWSREAPPQANKVIGWGHSLGSRLEALVHR